MEKGLQKLKIVMSQLRDPAKGCAWDLAQTFQSIAPHTLEETYEVIEAIEKNDPLAIKDELGDLLFQIVFHAQIAADQGLFTFEEIAQHAADKMTERHPHVFGDRVAATSGAVATNWEADKAAKREAAAKAENRIASALDGITTSLPATSRAIKLQNRAARVGFDWNNASDILAKITEEASELEAEMFTGDNKDRVEDELGDLFFALINLARRLDVDPESALRRTNRKFERRFKEIEIRLARVGREIGASTLEEMEALWNEIKREEKMAGSR